MSVDTAQLDYTLAESIVDQAIELALDIRPGSSVEVNVQSPESRDFGMSTAVRIANIKIPCNVRHSHSMGGRHYFRRI